ncbi:uncharacterized protein LOC131669711 [Phymastichus coffea]|uniref:uncharacterized protein LOC131669711 n=1 Tax=Phymastichus coffea TaxID=108790 RepID=UPI00273C498A|nr:uncharacterized protein LOC131669711 [Phymastichus coffea]
MSTMGLVYNAASGAGGGGGGEQVMLLRTLQDNESNIMGARACLAASGQQQPPPKHNASAIGVAHGEPLGGGCKGGAQALPAYDPSRLKKHGKNGQPPPIAVAKRNARERNRVKQVNNGFATLRQHIPSHVAQGYGDRGKKLSKVETLRMAVEYIRGLQRLLAEADAGGMELEARLGRASHESPMTIPSPAGSLYSSSTHNGSAEAFGLDDHPRELDLADEAEREEGEDEDDGEEEEEEEGDDDYDEEEALVERRRAQLLQRQRQRRADGHRELASEPPRDRRPGGRSRVEPRRAAGRLSENQNRERCRRREDGYFKQASFGDEENIEPLGARNNNNNSSLSNNNNVLAGFAPMLVQAATSAMGGLACVKREAQQPLDEEDGRRSGADEPPGGEGVILAASSPYTGEIFIESPGTGRLVPLKIEEHEAQLVYVGTGEPAYYKAELSDGAAELSWWEQECIVQQLQQQQQQQQQQHQQQQPEASAQRPLAHV